MLVLGITVISSCVKEPENIPVSAITLNTTSVTLSEGETTAIEATVSPSTATNKQVLWTTNNSAVATVSNGVVKAIGAGNATITAVADDNGKNASCSITVNAKIITVSSVSISTNGIEEIYDDEEVQWNASVFPDNATNKTVKWTSSDETIATVDNNGKITAIQAGEVTITVTTEDGNKEDSHSIKINSSKIAFADEYVKAVCVQRYDKDEDGEISLKEAASVTEIPTNFFGDAYKPAVSTFDELKYFTSVSVIKAHAFSTSSITSITLPSSVKTIEEGAFCCYNLKHVSLNEGLENIGNYAFRSCENLEELSLPRTLITIGEEAFADTPSLKQIEIPSGVSTLKEGLLIGSGITKVILNSGLKKIENYVFGDCINLQELIIPDTVTEYGHAIVYGCKKLSKITSKYSSEDERCLIIGGVLEGVAMGGLDSYEVPSTVSAIGERVFAKLTGLTHLILPKSIITIEPFAFAWNTGLYYLTINATNPPYLYPEAFAANNFEPCNIVNIYVPRGSIESYKSANEWEQFADKFVPIDNSQYVTVTAKGKQWVQTSNANQVTFHSWLNNPKNAACAVYSVYLVNQYGELVQIKGVTGSSSKEGYVQFDTINDTAHNGSGLCDYYSTWYVIYNLCIDGKDCQKTCMLNAHSWGG